MKRKHTKGSSRGRKKMAFEVEDDHSPSPSFPKGDMAMQSKRLTRSKAATVRKCSVQILDIALKQENGTRRATSKSSTKRTCARRFVEKNEGNSTNRGNQPTEEITDENAPNENQDTYPFKDSCDKFLAGEDAESQQPIVQNNLPSSVGKEKNNAQEAHSFQLTEWAAMMNRSPLDDDVELDQPRNPIIPFSTESVQKDLPSVAKEINRAHEAHSIGLTEMAAMMNHSPSHDEEEVGSSLSLINVEGYLVKKEIAPILKKIMDKYKDIAKECVIKDKESHVPSLEVICSTCQKLGEMSFKDVNGKELKGLLLVVEGIQHMGFDVKWLSERLEDLSKWKRLFDLRTVIKEADTKQDLQDEKICMLKQQIDMLKQQLAVEEAASTSKKMENDKARYDFDQGMKNLTPKGFQHWTNDLLYGLI